MALREILAHFGIEIETEKLEEADKSVDGVIDRLKEMAATIAGGEFAKQVFEFGNRISEQGEEIEHASIRLGIGTDALQEMGFAAAQSGADIGQLSIAMLMLEDKIGDALINPAGEGAKAFQKFGISFRDATGAVKSSDVLFQDIADKIADTTDESKQVAIAMGLFGRQGKALLPTLKLGKDGIAELRDEFQRLGGGMREGAIKASTDYEKQLHRLDVVHTGLSGAIGTILLPVLGRLVEWFTNGSKAMIGLVENSSIVQTTLGVLGAALSILAVKSAIAFAPWLLWAAALAGVILIIDDLVTMMRGGDSVIGRFIDLVGGEGMHVEVVQGIKDAWADFSKTIKEALPSLRETYEALKWIYDSGKGVAKIIGDISGALGDNAGKLDNYLYENYGVGGHVQDASATKGTGRSYDQNVARRQALGLISAQNAGQSYSPTEIPADYKGREAQFEIEVTRLADALRQQQAQVTSGVSLLTGGVVVQQENTINVHDATDPHKVASVVDDHLKKRHRAAADVLHKKVEAQ